MTYFIYHIKTKKYYEYLSRAGVGFYFKTDLNFMNWFIWQTGETSWANFTQSEQGFNDYVNGFQPFVIPELPLIQRDKIEVIKEGEFEIIEFTDNNGNGTSQREQRIFPRIRTRLRTIITDNKNAFLTYTQDISLSGFRLAQSIPQEIATNPIEVYITGPSGKDSVVFRCKAIQDPQGYYRFSFDDMNEVNQKKIGTWLTQFQP